MKIALSSEALSELKQVQRNVIGADYIKVTCILMLYQGFSPKSVSESLGIDVSTVYRYVERYHAGGVSLLTENRYKGY